MVRSPAVLLDMLSRYGDEDFGALIESQLEQLDQFIVCLIAPSGINGLAARRAFCTASREKKKTCARQHVAAWQYGIALQLASSFMVRQYLSPPYTSGLVHQTNATIHDLNAATQDLNTDLRVVMLLVACEEMQLDEAAILFSLPISMARRRIALRVADNPD